MSCVTDAIKKRHSIRKYPSRPVSTEILSEILEAASCAPSAHNAQPWRFIVLVVEALKQDLAEAMADAWMADMIKDGTSADVRENMVKASVKRFTRAPVLVIACVTMKEMTHYADESRQKCEHDLSVQSLGAAIQNMLLAAHAKGLGACWFCAPLFCKDAVRKVLKIPENVEPQALITLGYAAEKPSTSPLKLPQPQPPSTHASNCSPQAYQPLSTRKHAQSIRRPLNCPDNCLNKRITHRLNKRIRFQKGLIVITLQICLTMKKQTQSIKSLLNSRNYCPVTSYGSKNQFSCFSAFLHKETASQKCQTNGYAHKEGKRCNVRKFI